METNDLVLIEWEDSDGCPQGWIHHTDLHPANHSIINSVGWVQSVDKNCVRLVPHVAHNNGYLQCVQGYMTIPLSCILTVKNLQNVSPM